MNGSRIESNEGQGAGLDALGVEGFSYADTFRPERLRALAETFYSAVESADPALWARLSAYLDGAELADKAESELVVEAAPHLGRFVARLFGIQAEAEALGADARAQLVVFEFKKEFVRRRVLKKYSEETLPSLAPADAERRAALIRSAILGASEPADAELATAMVTMTLVETEKALVKGGDAAAGARDRARLVREAIGEFRELADDAQLQSGGADADVATIGALLADLEAYVFYQSLVHGDEHEYPEWVSFSQPHALDYQNLVRIERPRRDVPELFVGPDEMLRRRDGFKLTDRRMSLKQAMDQVDYCLYCHERDKDSCSKGFPLADGGFKKNPLGIPLAGCPLDEKISEMHLLQRAGETVAALAVVMIDNPMCPGTGHRICNDCMKSCIFQKQEPVNIPQIETHVLTSVLALPYGFEIYGLLTRWNPLNRKRPYALPYNGRNVLVVGLGPAGYTLAHYLLNEGFGVVAIDGLKIEPFAADLTGSRGVAPRPVRDYRELTAELDERVLAGFGGVSEYGITVRWDKNFLSVIHLTLARRDTLRVYGGVRFGGTLEIEDAWDLGFDHIAIASGAGRPTIIKMENNLIRGIRKASDFLMALQLTGAFKRDAIANLQVRLPAVIIGGGLTAVDTATELLAYYVVQCEKTLERFEALAAELGEERVWGMLDTEERGILVEFLDHGRAIRGERARAAADGEEPNFVPLLRSWGGVTIAYRKSLQDSPAYRLNHEEVTKALEEGIAFAEGLDPREAVPDKYSAVEAIVFERVTRSEDGRWSNSGESVTLPARSVCVAAGTRPNTIYEKERPGTFERDEWGEYFVAYAAERDESGAVSLVPSRRGFFTSYDNGGRFISYYGDNHPVYAGNVVKAMASAKDGYGQVAALFADETARLDPAAQPERDAALERLFATLDDELVARVVRVERLTQTIVDVVVRAPLAARKFNPGQFYRLQNFEANSTLVGGARLSMEGLALTGAWVDREKGLLSLIVLEMGGSSRLVAGLQPGEPVVVMGPTGTPTEIPAGETVLLAGGGLGNAVLFSIAKALRENGNRVLYFAGYKNPSDVFKRDEIEDATDQVIWSSDVGPAIEPRRPQDRAFVGNIVQSILAYAKGELGERLVETRDVDRIIAIGSDRMMAAVKTARHGVLAPYLDSDHVAIGSINSSMQCMMKEVCAQCLQKHVDPVTGKEEIVFSCYNQDQPLDRVDFKNLNDRLKMNSVQEKLTSLWLSHVLARESVLLV